MSNARPGPGSAASSRPARRRDGGKAAASKASKPPTAIREAARAEFIARGFTATRIDDVAKRAGVAKGTIYLHFKDKESMFEELIRTGLVPLLGRLPAPPP